MNKPLILCVEDNENDIFLMQRVFDITLQEFDYFFHTNVNDCIKNLNELLVNNKLPTIALVDIKLINSSGLDLLKFIKKDERFKTIPVIMLSSSDRQDDKMKAKNFGCDAYIEKPKNYIDLKLKIPEIVHFWSKNIENDTSED